MPTIRRSLAELVTFELECAVFHIEGKNDKQANHYLRTKTIII